MSKELNHLAAILHVYARGLNFMKYKKKFVIIFQKENGNTFTLSIIFVVKSLQKEQNSTNLLLWPPICRNKSAITPKWFNSLDTNSSLDWKCWFIKVQLMSMLCGHFLWVFDRVSVQGVFNLAAILHVYAGGLNFMK